MPVAFQGAGATKITRARVHSRAGSAGRGRHVVAVEINQVLVGRDAV